MYEQDAVIVILLNSSKRGLGDWKPVSVSSLGGIPRNSSLETNLQTSPCGSIGRYANSGAQEYLTVSIQLPDGATIVAFKGLIRVR